MIAKDELLRDATSRRVGDFLKIAVQDLLACWGYRVRDYDSVPHIEKELADAGLATEPSLEKAPSGGVIRLVPLGFAPAAPQEPHGEFEEADEARFTFPQAALLIRHIPSATAEVISVTPHDPLQLARDKLRGEGCHHVAVLAAPNDLRGVVTWESIIRASVGSGEPTLSDAAEDPEMVKLDGNLLNELPRIDRKGFAVACDDQNRVRSLVTTGDVSRYLEHLVRPYFLVGEIERRLRRQIALQFTQEDLKVVFRNVRSVHDFVFKQYEQLLTDADRWRQMSWSCDYGYFLGKLHEVRLIRNKIMHFKPQPLTQDELATLENAARFIRDLGPRR